MVVTVKNICFKMTSVNLVEFEVFTVVTMKNAVFWDIKTLYLTGDTIPLPYRVQPVDTM
jgi:hypothetical protein